VRINEVLRNKSEQDVITILPGASVRELLALLAEHNVGAAIVSSDGSTIDGIVSERDVVRSLHRNDAILEGPVSEIMTSVVQTCEGTSSVHELMSVMTEHRVRHVPVLTEGKLSGIISIGDVVKNRIGELEFERDQLDHYVHQT
jgi:CBS domain-containing protein